MRDHENQPSERSIGDGVRSDGPNGQGSTKNNASSIEEVQETNDRSRPRDGDHGWLSSRPDEDPGASTP